MEYRTLGRTGVKLSVLGFGASPLGHEFGKIDEDEGIAAVREAINAGMNYLDTSPFYGRGRSEEVLGRALKGVPRDKFFVSSKVGRYDVDKFDFSAERVVKSIDESLKRLQLDHIDLVICHDIEFGDLDVIINETIPALQRLRDQEKKLRFIGISGLPLHIFKYVLDRTDAVDVILTYCHHTLLDSSADSMLDYLTEKKVGIINASPTGMGLLTPQGPPAWHPAPDAMKQVSRDIYQLCESRGFDVTAVALRWAVASDVRFVSTLCGMSSREEVHKNIASVSDSKLDDKELLQAISKLVEPVHNVTWPSGRPENN